MSKKLIIVLSLLLTMALLASCATGNNTKPDTTAAVSTDQEASVEPSTIEKTTMTMMLVNENDHPFTDIKTNAFTVWMEQQTGVHLEFTILEKDVAQEKLALSLNSGNYTDMIAVNITHDNLNLYGMDSKLLIPLNKYIENSTYYKKVTERYPTLVTDLKLSDGNIYGMCGAQDMFHSMEKSGKLYINVNWLKKLGLSMPTTTEEFANVLRAFRDNDPNGNKNKDEIPMSGCVPDWASYPHLMLMNAFCYFPDWWSMSYCNKNGEIIGVFEQDGFKEGLKYIAGLYAEGLIDPASYTQNNDDFEAQLADCNSIGAFNKGHMGTSFYNVDAKAYDLVLPLKGPSGRQGLPWSDEVIETSAKFVITDKCKDPDRAFAWADFLFSDEASWNQYYGPKGVLWDYADSGTTLKGTKAEFVQLKSSFAEDTDLNNRWGFQRLGQHDFETRMAVSGDIYALENYIQRLGAQSQEYAKYAVDTSFNLPIVKDTDEESQLKTSLQKYYQQAITEFIAGRRSIDKDWDKFIADLKNLKWDRWLEIYKENYTLSKYYKGN